jgi:hypothetical protein
MSSRSLIAQHPSHNMPVSTRSSGKQAQKDESTETKVAVTSKKRKAPSGDPKPDKRITQQKHVQDLKPSHASDEDSSQTKPGKSESKPESTEFEDSILINRAPVLELWAATVTSFLYPKISWETSLSAGSAISTLCAISKGRAIGTVEKKYSSAAKKQRRELPDDQVDELEIMGFHLKLRDGQVLVGDKPKQANESALVKKFGEETYGRVKSAFQEALQLWAGQEDELNSRASHCYKDFRPAVSKGQKGWGRKGMLNLQTVKDAVSPT